MRWSLKLGRIAGIKLFVHWTFFLLLGWICLVYWEKGQGFSLALDAMLFVLAVFGCVILHELGHALTARRYGIQTRDITLLPIGGVARLERMPREPRQELWVALAGPAVNVVIAALIFLPLWATGYFQADHFTARRGDFWAQLMVANVVIIVFNMLPAFPMDGGRVLRALLAQRLDYVKATLIAARVGQVMAMVFGVLALWVSPLLIVIGIFVFLGAASEAQMAQISRSMEGLTVQQAMMTDFRSLPAQAPLNVAVSELLAGSQQDFPVVQGEDVVGLLGRNDLVKALVERGPAAPVSEAMQANCRVVNEDEKLEECYNLLRSNGCTSAPVVRQGRLIGFVTLENISEWLMVHSALRQGQAA